MALKLKTGGRVKGLSTNKITRELKEIIKDLLQKEFENIGETLQKFEPDKRLEIIIKLLPFALPKIQSIQQVEIKTDNNCNKIVMLTEEQKQEIIDKL